MSDELVKVGEAMDAPRPAVEWPEILGLSGPVSVSQPLAWCVQIGHAAQWSLFEMEVGAPIWFKRGTPIGVRPSTGLVAPMPDPMRPAPRDVGRAMSAAVPGLGEAVREEGAKEGPIGLLRPSLSSKITQARERREAAARGLVAPCDYPTMTAKRDVEAGQLVTTADVEPRGRAFAVARGMPFIDNRGESLVRYTYGAGQSATVGEQRVSDSSGEIRAGTPLYACDDGVSSVPPVNVAVQPQDFAPLLDALRRGASPAPRCPSCDSSRYMRKTDHGDWFCAGACGGWHGRELTPPVVPRFAVGDWVRAKPSATLAQVVAIRSTPHGRDAWQYTLTNADESGVVERNESALVAAERPR